MLRRQGSGISGCPGLTLMHAGGGELEPPRVDFHSSLQQVMEERAEPRLDMTVEGNTPSPKSYPCPSKAGSELPLELVSVAEKTKFLRESNGIPK